MKYYLFMEYKLARKHTTHNLCEWLINGEWKIDPQSTLSLEDALHDYGDYSIGDQIQITPKMAKELIQNGGIELLGDIGFGHFYNIPATVQLSNWKKPTK